MTASYPSTAISATIMPQSSIPNNALVLPGFSNIRNVGAGLSVVGNQFLINALGIYIVTLTILTDRPGGASTTGYVTIIVNGTNQGVGSIQVTGANEEVGNAILIASFSQGDTVQAGIQVSNNNVDITRGYIGMAGLFG